MNQGSLVIRDAPWMVVAAGRGALVLTTLGFTFLAESSARRFRPAHDEGAIDLDNLLNITGPKLLLADEPTTALEVAMAARIIHLLKQFQAKIETDVAVVSHNLGLIAALCSIVTLHAA